MCPSVDVLVETDGKVNKYYIYIHYHFATGINMFILRQTQI